MRLVFITALIFTAAIVVLLIFINSHKENVPKKYEQLTLSLIKDKNFLNTIRLEHQKEKDKILIETSKILRNQIHTVTDNKHKDFVTNDFNNVMPIIDFMLAIDSINGHAIYFKGEVYRLLNDYDRFVKYFQMYLNIEASIGSQLPKVTNARLCYETAHGYCEQRTAWISQLLANYYYRKGISESDLNKKLEYFSVATKQIQNVMAHFPNGFKSSSVTMSTLELETNLSKQLSEN